MANTTTRGKYYLSVQFDGSTNWDSATYFSGGVMIESIKLVPSASNDYILVRENSATGPYLSYLKSSDGEARRDPIYCIRPIHIYVVATECSIATPANARMILELRG